MLLLFDGGKLSSAEQSKHLANFYNTPSTFFSIGSKAPIPIPWKYLPHLHLSAALVVVATTMAVFTPPSLPFEHYFQLPSYVFLLLFVHPAGTSKLSNIQPLHLKAI